MEETEIHRIRKVIKENKRKDQEIKIGAIEKNRSMKCWRPRLGRLEMNKIKDMTGVETNIKDVIENITHFFYTKLYQTKRNHRKIS